MYVNDVRRTEMKDMKLLENQKGIVCTQSRARKAARPTEKE